MEKDNKWDKKNMKQGGIIGLIQIKKSKESNY